MAEALIVLAYQLMSIFLQILLNGITLSAIYALIAGGLSFLYATSKIFHLAHGVVVIGAGYSFWCAFTVLGWHPLFAVLFAILVAAVVGLLMNELVYERLRARGAKGLGYLIATLALLMLGTGLIQLLFTSQPRTFQIEPRVFEWNEVRITSIQLATVIVSVLLLAGFYWLTKFTKFGKAMRATADNETVAEVLGIDTKKIRRLAFLFSSVLAAAAGIFVGLEFNLDPNMSVALAVTGFTAAVIGGVGSLGGAIVGSLIIGFLEQGVVWYPGAGWRNAVTFLLLFVFLLVRPTGLFGGARK